MNKKAKITLGIIIALIVIVFVLYRNFYNGPELMLNDAKVMLTQGQFEMSMNKLDETSNTTCLYVYGYESHYNNSGNYVGSIDLTGEEPYIELSDGKYFVRGTINDLTIIKSNLTASTSCNK